MTVNCTLRKIEGNCRLELIILKRPYCFRKSLNMSKLQAFRYCSLVISHEVFFVSEGHRKPETYRANLCD